VTSGLLSVTASILKPYTALNPSQLQYWEGAHLTLAPLAVNLESNLLDFLVKLGIGVAGGVSTSVDDFLHRESGAHREEHRAPASQQSVSTAAASDLSGGSSASTAAAADAAAGAATVPGGAVLPDVAGAPAAKGTAAGVASLEAEHESVLVPTYIRAASLSALTVLFTYSNSGRYVGGSDAGVPPALRHVLRFLPTIRDVPLAVGGVTVADARYNPGELAALLLRHFATEGLSQLRSIIGGLTFSKLEHALLGGGADDAADVADGDGADGGAGRGGGRRRGRGGGDAPFVLPVDQGSSEDSDAEAVVGGVGGGVGGGGGDAQPSVSRLFSASGLPSPITSGSVTTSRSWAVGEGGRPSAPAIFYEEPEGVGLRHPADGLDGPGG